MKINVKPKKVSKKNFKKFGQIIDTSKKKYFKINKKCPCFWVDT